MSTETPETKNPYRLRREAIDRAVKAWQEQDDEELARQGCVPNEIDDCLMDEGLILMPRSTGYGKWVVEVDGQRTPIAPGSTNATGLLDAEDAAEVFLTVTAADEHGMKKVTVRPATEWEHKAALAAHLFGGGA